MSCFTSYNNQSSVDTMAMTDLEHAPPNSGLSSDKALRPFLAPLFDPADFLNATLPSWTSTSTTTTQRQSSCASLSEQTQALSSQLNAHLNRLSTTLTQLTDEILRSGPRLAYDVEVLRGDTTTLAETMTQGLRRDVERFAPLESEVVGRDAVLSSSGVQSTQATSGPGTPDYIDKLHTLSIVRSRLETVIKVFGDAIEWVIPPSETTNGSSFVSIAAPRKDDDLISLEAKGRAYSEDLRLELSDILTGGEPDAVRIALDRMATLKALAEVWKGTAEEKARIAFVESLTGFVRDRM